MIVSVGLLENTRSASNYVFEIRRIVFHTNAVRSNDVEHSVYASPGRAIAIIAIVDRCLIKNHKSSMILNESCLFKKKIYRFNLIVYVVLTDRESDR